MTDIVNRLRAYAEANEMTGLYTESKCAYDAIEEIERLREKCNQAPEHIIFCVDIDNIPIIKAEEYLSDIMVKYRNKLV